MLKNFPTYFKKRKKGLILIAEQNIIKTPTVIDCFEKDGGQILILEWIESGTKTKQFWEDFGKQLTALHYCTNDYFGLEKNNYMGSVGNAMNFLLCGLPSLFNNVGNL
ncbi:MAG: hypothetical protein C4329_04915 [Chitinophagaceae bacterium]